MNKHLLAASSKSR